MKITALILSLCLSLSAFAQTGTVSELERAFDEYQYALTVEWDQKNQDFYQSESKKMIEKLTSLIEKKGLSKDEVLRFAESKIKNNKAIDALALKVSLLSPEASSQELIEILKETSGDFYSKGASWNGAIVFESILWMAAGLILLSALYHEIFMECVEYRETDDIVCQDEVLYSGWDSSGNSYTVYGETSCDYKKVCEEWKKK